ncbi:Uncharacterised protein [Mycobacteroides abscessus]|nr:Uncharacterised protein [Mycobacteroides abscessus]
MPCESGGMSAREGSDCWIHQAPRGIIAALPASNWLTPFG